MRADAAPAPTASAAANTGSLANSFDRAAEQETIKLARTQVELVGMVAPIIFDKFGDVTAGKYAEGVPEGGCPACSGGALVAGIGGN